MTDRQLDAAIERYYDRMLDRIESKSDCTKCSYCRYYYQGYCDLLAEEEDPVDDGSRDDDDWCEAFESREDDIPEWMEDK